MSDNVGVFEAVENMACTDVLHPQSSCIHSVSHLVRHNFKTSMSIYIPLSFLFLALSKQGFNPSTFGSAIKSGFKSGLWLTIWVPGFSALMCAYYNRYRQHSKLATFLSGFISGFVAMEMQPAQPLRNRVMLMILNMALETAYKLLASVGLVKLIPNGECLVFATALSILSYQQKNHPDDVAPMLKRPMQYIEGDVKREKPSIFVTEAIDRKLRIPSEFASSPAGYVLSGTLRSLSIGVIIRTVGTLVNYLKFALGRAPVPNPSANVGFLERNGLTLFLASTTFLFRCMRLLIEKAPFNDFKWAPLLPGLVAGAGSIFFPSVAISQIMLCQAIDGVWKSIVAKKYIVPPKRGGSILFGLCSAVLMYAAVFNKSTLRSTMSNIFNKLSDGNFTNFPKLASK